MAKPSIENITVNSKNDVAAGGKEWDVSFTCITSLGTRFEERKYFGPASPGAAGLTKNKLWDAMRAIANGHEAAEQAPKVVTPLEFEGRLDATSGTPTTLDPADYPTV